MAIALLLGGAYWIQYHQFDIAQSLRQASEAEELETTERRSGAEFANQQGTTGVRSASGRAMLAGSALACCGLALGSSARWNRGLLLLGIAFLGWCFLSMVWADSAELTFKRFVLFGLVFAATHGFAARFEAKDFMKVVMIVTSAWLVVGAAATLYHQDWQYSDDYRFGGAAHPNNQAIDSILLMLAAWLYPWQGPRSIWIQRGLIGAGAFALLLTKSRTSLAAAAITVVFVAVMRAPRRQRALVAASLVVVGCLGALAMSFASMAATSDAMKTALMNRDQGLSTLNGRWPLWVEAVKPAMDHAWLGHGYGGYWTPETTLWFIRKVDWPVHNAHNLYLELWLGVGLIGVALFLAWWGGCFVVAITRYWQTQRTDMLFVAAILLFAFLHGWNESTFVTWGFAAFSFTCAMALAAAKLPQVAVSNSMAASAPQSEVRGRQRQWATPNAVHRVRRTVLATKRTQSVE